MARLGKSIGAVVKPQYRHDGSVTETGDDVAIPLRRPLGQRAFGWLMAVLLAGTAAGWPLLAIGPWTYFRSDPGPVKWPLLVVAPLASVALARTSAAAYRLATTRPGVVRLDEQAITIVDPSVFREPLRLTRADVADISPAPSGIGAFSVSGAAVKENAALLSLYPERPNVLLRFARPRRLEMARWNQGLQATYALRAPSPRKSVDGLWLRTEDEAGRGRLVSWTS